MTAKVLHPIEYYRYFAAICNMNLIGFEYWNENYILTYCIIGPYYWRKKKQHRLDYGRTVRDYYCFIKMLRWRCIMVSKCFIFMIAIVSYNNNNNTMEGLEMVQFFFILTFSFFDLCNLNTIIAWKKLITTVATVIYYLHSDEKG